MSKPWPMKTVLAACPQRNDTVVIGSGRLKLVCTDCNVTVYAERRTIEFSEKHYPGWPIKIVCPQCLAEYELPEAPIVLHDLRKHYDPLHN